jgi:hypothetical protein
MTPDGVGVVANAKEEGILPESKEKKHMHESWRRSNCSKSVIFHSQILVESYLANPKI